VKSHPDCTAQNQDSACFFPSARYSQHVVRITTLGTLVGVLALLAQSSCGSSDENPGPGAQGGGGASSLGGAKNTGGASFGGVSAGGAFSSGGSSTNPSEGGSAPDAQGGSDVSPEGGGGFAEGGAPVLGAGGTTPSSGGATASGGVTTGEGGAGDGGSGEGGSGQGGANGEGGAPATGQGGVLTLGGTTGVGAQAGAGGAEGGADTGPVETCNNGRVDAGEQCCSAAFIDSQISALVAQAAEDSEGRESCVPRQQLSIFAACDNTNFCAAGATGCKSVVTESNLTYQANSKSVLGSAKATVQGHLSVGCNFTLNLSDVTYTADVIATVTNQVLEIRLDNADFAYTPVVTGCSAFVNQTLAGAVRSTLGPQLEAELISTARTTVACPN